MQSIQDSITKIYSDGAINYLEMGRCPALKSSNKLRVVAQNSLGQTDAGAVLTVVLAEDFRSDLKHVQTGHFSTAHALLYHFTSESNRIHCT